MKQFFIDLYTVVTTKRKHEDCPPPLPYLPLGKELLEVDCHYKFMSEARKFSLKNNKDEGHPTGAIIVKNGEIIGSGANGSSFHEYLFCVRKFFKAETGKYYSLCRGCSPKNHAEQKAIKNAKGNTNNADLYLWGHWWCCESCWDAMIEAGIKNVFLANNAFKLFETRIPKEKMNNFKIESKKIDDIDFRVITRIANKELWDR